MNRTLSTLLSLLLLIALVGAGCVTRGGRSNNGGDDDDASDDDDSAGDDDDATGDDDDATGDDDDATGDDDDSVGDDDDSVGDDDDSVGDDDDSVGDDDDSVGDDDDSVGDDDDSVGDDDDSVGDDDDSVGDDDDSVGDDDDSTGSGGTGAYVLPCGTSQWDIYEVFGAGSGDTVFISIDTISSTSTFDPYLVFMDNANSDPASSTMNTYDDVFTCTFPPPQYSCPEGDETVPSGQTLYFAVGHASDNCAGTMAEYSVDMTVNGSTSNDFFLATDDYP